MALLVKILILIIGLTAGTVAIKYNYQLTHLFGYNSLAERYLGTAGTYTMWRLIGVVAIVVSVIYVFT